MRTFIIYSETARTDTISKDLRAGRFDILLHSLTSALFSSNNFRENVEVHLILMGEPNPPKHICIKSSQNTTISKKNLKKTIEKCLRKKSTKQPQEVSAGVFVDTKNIEEILHIFSSREIFLLDKFGTHIKELDKEMLKDGVFVLGDHTGFSKKTKKFLKKNIQRLSLGEHTYFTSQSITIINYELDNPQ